MYNLYDRKDVYIKLNRLCECSLFKNVLFDGREDSGLASSEWGGGKAGANSRMAWLVINIWWLWLQDVGTAIRQMNGEGEVSDYGSWLLCGTSSFSGSLPCWRTNCRVNVLLHRLWASPNSVPGLDRAGLDKPTEVFWCSSNGFSLIKSWNPTYSFIPKCSCRAISATIPTIGFWGIPYIHRGNIQMISNDYMQLKCDNSAMAIGAEINPTSWL